MKFVYSDGGRSKYYTAVGVGDCVTRAIANATGKDYQEVYKALKELNGGKSCRNGTPKSVGKEYLKRLGWVWHPTMQIGEGCKVHLRAEELPAGILIVQASKHLTCVKDGTLYDTYDCSREGGRCVYGYWTAPKAKPKYQVGDIVNYKGHECVITARWIAGKKAGASIKPTGDYGFEIDLYLEQLKKGEGVKR